jgi:MFS family permease
VALNGAVGSARRAAAPSPAALVLVLATLGQMAASLAQQGLIELVVYFRALDHLSLVAMGALAAAPPLGTMLGMTPAGAIVDRDGVGRTALAGALGMAVCAALVFVWTPGPVALLAVLLVGVGAFGAVMPMAGAAAVLWAFGPEHRATAMGIRQSGVTLGAAVGAAVLPTLVATWGLRPVLFALAVPVALFGSLLARATWRLGGRLAGGHAAGRRPAARGGVAAPAALLGVLPVAAVGALLAAGQYDTLAYAITYLHTGAALGLAAAGGVLAVAQVGGTLARVGVGVVTDRLRLRTGQAIALVAGIGFVALVAFSLAGRAPLAVWLGLSFVLGMGAIGWNALLLTWAAERVEPALRATAMGVSGTGVFLGATIFPPVFGEVATATRSLPDAWRSVALLYGAALALVALLLAREPAPAREAAPVAASGAGNA